MPVGVCECERCRTYSNTQERTNVQSGDTPDHQDVSDPPWRDAFYAIVQLKLDVPDQARACTRLSEYFGQSLSEDKPGTLIDWQYFRVGAMPALPSRLLSKGPQPENDTYMATVELCMSVGDWDLEHDETCLEDLIWTVPCVSDWKYLEVDGQVIRPQSVLIPPITEYEEGDAFDPDIVSVV